MSLDEKTWIQGNNAAWRSMLSNCCRELGYDNPEVEKVSWITERVDTISILRSACSEFGDNEWEDDLHLADVIEKHLQNHLEQNRITSEPCSYPKGLKEWLLSREEEIAQHCEDLGDLNSTFSAVIGRDAE